MVSEFKALKPTIVYITSVQKYSVLGFDTNRVWGFRV